MTAAGRQLAERYAIAVYCFCFAVGTSTHVMAIWSHGVVSIPAAPLSMNVFWTSLVVLNPLVIVLLLTGRRRGGLLLALAIMCIDVAVNSYALFALHIPGFTAPLLLQTAFFGFVLGSIVFLWPRREATGGSS